MSYANLVATSYTMTNIKIREKLSTTALQTIYATMDNTVQFVSTEKERERGNCNQKGQTDGHPFIYFDNLSLYFEITTPPFLMGGGGWSQICLNGR